MTPLIHENPFWIIWNRHRRFPKCHLYRIKQRNITNQKKYWNILMNTNRIWFQYIFQMSLWYWNKYGNIPKKDLLVLQNYSSFTECIIKISRYYRTKRFNLNSRIPHLRWVSILSLIAIISSFICIDLVRLWLLIPFASYISLPLCKNNSNIEYFWHFRFVPVRQTLVSQALQ